MAGIQADRMIRALQRLGFVVVRSRGSHHALAKPGHPGVITVAFKKGRAIPEGTARAILKQAGVSEDDFFSTYR